MISGGDDGLQNYNIYKLNSSGGLIIDFWQDRTRSRSNRMRSQRKRTRKQPDHEGWNLDRPHRYVYSPTASLVLLFFHRMTVPNPPLPKDLSRIQSPIFGNSSIMMRITAFNNPVSTNSSGPTDFRGSIAMMGS